MRRYALVIALLLAPTRAAAFGGVVLTTEPNHMAVVDSAMVGLAREGDITVLTLRIDYRGPEADFAILVPVPEGFDPSTVRTLDQETLDQLEQMSAPRMFEYLERDPCWNESFPTPRAQGHLSGWLGSYGGRSLPRWWAPWPTSPLRAVVTHVATSGHQIEVCDATRPDALVRWLRTHGYQIPERFEEVVAPHLASGRRFLVARVSASTLHFEDGVARVRPLRLQFHSERLTLPVRLGVLNAGDRPQDLVVHVLARETRYDAASFTHTVAPTHYRVSEEASERFGVFYEALFDALLALHPDSVVTEFAAGVNGAETNVRLGLEPIFALAEPLLPPVEHVLSRTRAPAITVGDVQVDGLLTPEIVVREFSRRPGHELRRCYECNDANGADLTLTFDAVAGQSVSELAVSGETDALVECLRQRLSFWRIRGAPDATSHVTITVPSPLRDNAPVHVESSAPWHSNTELVLTRLHMHVDASAPDLVLVPAPAITGGTYRHAQGSRGPWLVGAARPAERNDFETRYFVGREYEGPVSCGETAVRQIWEPSFRGQGRDVGPYAGFSEDGELVPEDAPVVLEDLVREPIPELELQPRIVPTPPHVEVPPTTLQPIQGIDEHTPEPSGCGCHVTSSGASSSLGLSLALMCLLWRRRLL